MKGSDNCSSQAKPINMIDPIIKFSNKINLKNIVIYTTPFFLIIAIGYSPVYLQGKSLIWEIDGIGQYYPAFLYIGKFIRTFLTGGVYLATIYQ